VFVGFCAGVITCVGLELTGPAVPAEFEAVTSTSSVWPTSADAATYDADLAPLIAAQPFPLSSQRVHWYV
jgi:hypothetical protein